MCPQWHSPVTFINVSSGKAIMSAFVLQILLQAVPVVNDPILDGAGSDPHVW
jgi:hypothetical protein